MTTPSFRATAEAGQASGATLTITKPAGTVDGDCMVAVIDHPGTVTPPAGWTALYDSVYATNRLWVGYKIASSEGANYAFTMGASGSQALGHITSWQNVDATRPLIGLQTTIPATTSAKPIPQAYNTSPNSVALAIFVYKNSSLLTAPAGYTLRESTVQGSVSAYTASLAVATEGAIVGGTSYTGGSTGNGRGVHLILRGTGEKVTKPQIAAVGNIADENRSAGSTALLESVSTGPLVLTTAVQPKVDDILLALIWQEADPTTFTTPSGWTLITSGVSESSNGLNLFAKVAGASEPTSHSFTYAPSAADTEGLIVRIEGGSLNAALYSIAVQTGASKDSVLGALSSVMAGTLLLAAIAHARDSIVPMTSAGFTAIVNDVGDVRSAQMDHLSIGRKATAGVPGPYTFAGNVSGTADTSVGILLGIEAAIPLAPTVTAPAANLVANLTAGITFTWTHNDDLGLAQAGWALKRRAVSLSSSGDEFGGGLAYAAEEWWNGSAWVSTETVNSGAGGTSGSITDWASGSATYEYAIATTNGGSLVGAYSAWRSLNPYEFWTGSAWTYTPTSIATSAETITIGAANFEKATYKWSVAALDATGLWSAYPATRSFTVGGFERWGSVFI